VSYAHSVYSGVYEEILVTKDMSPEILHQLATIAKEFSKLFVPVEPKFKKVL
jgi:hypothetical protein